MKHQIVVLYQKDVITKPMFTISEFSRFAQVSADLLRYYDRIDLFKPDHINEQNGYRYYRIEQLVDLNRILALKEFGLSLDQIRVLLNESVSVDEISGMLKLQKLRTEELIQDELQRLQKIESRLAYLMNNDDMPTYEVKLKAIEQHVWVYAEKKAFEHLTTGEFFAYAYETLKPLLNKGLATYHICQLRHGEMNHSDWAMGIMLENKEVNYQKLLSDTAFNLGYLPHYNQVASTIFTGKMSDFYQAYNRLGYWIDEHGYQILDNAYEVIYQLDTTPNGDMNTIEVRIPIIEKTN